MCYYFYDKIQDILRKYNLGHVTSYFKRCVLNRLHNYMRTSMHEYIYLVRLKMINDAGEEDVATLSDRVIFQECQKFGQDLRFRRRLT